VRRAWVHRWYVRRYDWHFEDAYLRVGPVSFAVVSGPSGSYWRVELHRWRVELTW